MVGVPRTLDETTRERVPTRRGQRWLVGNNEVDRRLTMTDDPAPGTGASDGRTDSESSENGEEDLEAENQELRSRVEELETMLGDMQDELADVKRATGTDDGGVEAPGPSDGAEATPELVTQGGQPTKVIGRLSDTSGIGVLGEATGSGTTTGVWGTVDSDTGEGVYGEGKTGTAEGVFGKTTAPGTGALFQRTAGVRGLADSDNSSAKTYGVYGLSLNDHEFATGVRGQFGQRTTSSPDTPNARGVEGINNSGGDGSAGVYGSSTDANGVVYGVYASNNSDETGAAAVRAESSSDVGVSTDSNIDADGYVDASQGYRGAIGSSAYLSSDYSVSNQAKIPFDSEVADQRFEFNTVNNWFECAYDGAYVVELGLESLTATSGTVSVVMQIDQGNASSNPADDQDFFWDFDPPDGGAIARTFTKTIYGLLAGNRIYFEISDSDSSLELTSGANETFFSVRQVGGGGQYTSSPQSDAVVESSENE
jgi:hypothetical protein